MTEKIIQTRRGLYGQLSVTLPVTVKAAMLDLQKKSGMKNRVSTLGPDYGRCGAVQRHSSSRLDSR